MKLTILGNCVTTPQDVVQTVDTFAFDVTIPDDYRQVSLPRGDGLAFLRYFQVAPGKWRTTVEVTSPPFTVDFGVDADDIRHLIGFGNIWGVFIDDNLLFPFLTGEIVTGPDYDPHAIRFSSAGPVAYEAEYPRLGGQGRCFSTEADIVPQQILISGYPGPERAPNTGIYYSPLDYGYPREITFHVHGELVEAAP